MTGRDEPDQYGMLPVRFSPVIIGDCDLKYELSQFESEMSLGNSTTAWGPF